MALAHTEVNDIVRKMLPATLENPPGPQMGLKGVW